MFFRLLKYFEKSQLNSINSIKKLTEIEKLIGNKIVDTYGKILLRKLQQITNISKRLCVRKYICTNKYIEHLSNNNKHESRHA